MNPRFILREYELAEGSRAVTIFGKTYKVLNEQFVVSGDGRFLCAAVSYFVLYSRVHVLFSSSIFYDPTIVLTPKQTVEHALLMKGTVSFCFVGCEEKRV
jgi:hypothetical protein